jgi:ubiquinone/menaquinone biosynthesis C-methylase UbiE
VKSEQWAEKMANLMERRKNNDIRKQPVIDNYESHMKRALDEGWIKGGSRVLDVGCGDCVLQAILGHLGWEGDYVGIDPFATAEQMADGVYSLKIETMDKATMPDKYFDSTLCFAVLDGTEDIEEALRQINRVTGKSIIILTGLGIAPDKCHTWEITTELLDLWLSDFKRTDTIQLHPKVALIHYGRKGVTE